MTNLLSSLPFGFCFLWLRLAVAKTLDVLHRRSH